jgi:protein-tyrosine phosphatase
MQLGVLRQESTGADTTRPRHDGGMTASADAPFRVVFVCSGNICRSPMAEVVFRRLAETAGLGAHVSSTSAGTGDWHVGERADHRTIAALDRLGYDGAAHRARQFQYADFARNDLVVALDRSHERVLRGWAQGDDDTDKIALLQSFLPDAETLDVPDPYYAGAPMFDEVLGMIERASRALFRQLEPAIRSAG